VQSGQEIMELRELLQFYKAAGADDAVSDLPFDAFAAPAPAPKTPAAAPEIAAKANTPSAAKPAVSAAGRPQYSPAPMRPHSLQPMPLSDALAQAEKMAAAARNLTELKRSIAEFNGCNLKATAKNTCIADGSRHHPLMLIGEGPGAEEDRQAIPFVGPAGQLLTLILKAINFSRESLEAQEQTQADSAPGADKEQKLAYITNAVFWRPPGNRNPTAEEIALCHPFLIRQIELVRPKILVILGGVAASAILGGKQSILRLRGAWRTYTPADGAEIPLMPTLHPSYLLRAPMQKKLAWQDFLNIKMRLKTLGIE